MRQIGTLAHENQAKRFINYLVSKGVNCKCEVSFEPQDGHMAYQIWVQDEDKIEEASGIFADFEKNPMNSLYDAPDPEPEVPPVQDEPEGEVPVHHFKTHLTYFFIALCSLVFLLSYLQSLEIKKIVGVEKGAQMLTPIQVELMFDVPNNQKVPYWQGFYGWVVAKVKGESLAPAEGPLFEKIREGEFWRLFTPCLLHKDLLHILFNMLWLWYLGRPIEQRIGPFRMLIFTLLVGVLTNVLQYLMSGPLFIGYSGIVTGLAGFIWMRERIASWEGYPLTKGTILFLAIFVLAILGLQIISFFLEVFTSYTFSPNVGNTSHIGGALIGAFLGRLSFFRQRVKS